MPARCLHVAQGRLRDDGLHVLPNRCHFRQGISSQQKSILSNLQDGFVKKVVHNLAMVTVQFYTQASMFLAGLDEDWARLVAEVGPCRFESKTQRDPYQALVRAVAYQQLHPKAGDAILSRFVGMYQGVFPQPQQLLDTTFDALRACGFSARKIETIQGVALGALSGKVPSHTQAVSMSDEALIEQLVKLKGIGRWTVEMLLIFTLERMDILAADDYGLALGYQRLKGLEKPPKPKELAKIGEAWSPYRTVASWYLWRVPKT